MAKRWRHLPSPSQTRSLPRVAACSTAEKHLDAPLYVEAGQHFDAGEPLYIVEVMKMFNKVVAPFAGTIDEVLVEGDGIIIAKGQPCSKSPPTRRLKCFR
ncbi:MAG: hypothetical protein CM15mP84_08510 [Cellvibrionales bacterium]|nr:MAG: hypothetical protein CM15mP84_08510 [Cellvibrionales bacterium]